MAVLRSVDTPAANHGQALQGYDTREYTPDVSEAEQESFQDAEARYNETVPDTLAYQPESEQDPYSRLCGESDVAPAWVDQLLAESEEAVRQGRQADEGGEGMPLLLRDDDKEASSLLAELLADSSDEEGNEPEASGARTPQLFSVQCDFCNHWHEVTK